MRIKNQLEYRDNALSQLRNLYFGPWEADSKTLYENKAIIFSFLKEKKVPNNMLQYIHGYDHAMYDTFMKERVIFLYCVEGKFYKTQNSVEIDLPVWDVLPREMWGKLSEHGGFYYHKSLKKFS